MRKHCLWPFNKLLQLVTISFLLLVPLYLGADTITADQSLTGNETIESEGGNFVLGFFEPPGSKSSNFYIATWYKKVSELTPVWVANRDSPISCKYSSHLKLLDGNLVLTNGSKEAVWSTNLTTTAVASKLIQATLLDNGNFVLREGSSSSQFIWQSFDHPTHTWLPGCKLGFNEKTKSAQHLTAWKNSADQATGLFSLEISPSATGDWLALWNTSVSYWAANYDFRTRKFLLPSINLEYICNFSFVYNENESYYTYTLFNPSKISRLIMDVSGQIKLEIWKQKSKQWDLFWSAPKHQCEVYAFCGAFGTCEDEYETSCNCLTGFSPKSKSDWDLGKYSGGCVRDTRLHCGNNITKRDRDRFFLYQSMRLPTNPEYVTAHSQEHCQSACLNNCSCTAYTYYSIVCMIWIGDLLDMKQPTFHKSSSGQNLYLRLAASEFPSNKKVPRVLVGSIAGNVLVLVLLFTAILAIYRRKKMRSSGKTMAVEGGSLLLAFAYRDLQKATKNFSEKLGGGAFGSVFKGTLPDSSVIAVKRLESVSQGEKQFRSEVSTLRTIQHVNLVRLRGFCAEGTTRKLLVYDYMPNGSLETHLFCKKGYSIVLAWKTRYRIALGAASGLAYLHDNCRDRIIHCDVKPENILLDADFCPKVGDFGLAKLIGRDFSRLLTTLRGTRGYLAPEWILGAAITAKADVYSYGMMLFEILSGRRNTASRRLDQDGDIIDFFPAWAASQIISGGEDIIGILDERLEGKADREEAVRICKLACWCIQDDESHRPSMGEVVRILEGVSDVNMPPVPRSLQLLFVENQDNTVFFTNLSSSQGNTSTYSSRSQEQHQQSAINPYV